MHRFAVGMSLLVMVLGMTEPCMAQWRGGIGVGGGYAAGGKLYRASSTANAPVWPLPGGGGTVAGTEIRAEVDGFASFGARATLEHEGGFGAILSVSISDLDVSVIRRTVAENVEKVPWDQYFTTNVNLVGTWSLIAGAGSTPYLLAGLGFATLGSEGAELDQSSLGAVLGAGYRLRVGKLWQLDFELRDTIVGLDLDDEEERLSEVADRFEAESRMHLVDVSAALSLVF